MLFPRAKFDVPARKLPTFLFLQQCKRFIVAPGMSFCGKVGRFVWRSVCFCFRQIPLLLGLILLAQLGLLHIAISDFKAPEFLVSRLSEIFESQGLRCSVGEIRLRNLTVLTARDVRIDTLRGNDPLLKVRRCAVKFAPEIVFTRNFIPQFLYADGVEIFCPSASSAGGRAEQLLSDGALTARRSRGKIDIFSARGRVGTHEAVVYGKIPGTREFFLGEKTPEAAESEPPEPRKLSAIFSGIAGKISEILGSPAFRQLPENISAEIALSEGENSTVLADATVFCPELNATKALRFEKIAATQRFLFAPRDRAAFPRGPMLVSAATAEFSAGELFSERISARARQVHAATALPQAVFAENATSAERLPKKIFLSTDRIRAASLVHGAAEFSGFSAIVRPEIPAGSEFPSRAHFSANISSGAQQFTTAGTLDASDAAGPSLRFDYNLFFDKDELLALPQLRFLAENADLKELRFGEHPHVRGAVTFAPGMKFGEARVELLAGQTDCGNIHLRALQAAGTIRPTAVAFPKIQAVGADFTANADVFVEIGGGQNFRVRTWGSVDPHCIDGRLGWFWERIWRDLRPAPAARRPRADIDVYGKWTDRWEHVFGAIAGENCWGNGVLVDKVSLRVYEDPTLITAFDMLFRRGNDVVRGNLQWHYAMEPRYHYRDFRFLFSGTIPPKDVLQIVGEGLPEALADLETEGAGTAVVSGLFSGDPEFYPDRMVVNVKGSVPGKFSIFGIEGEDFAGEIIYDNGVVFVGNPFTARSGPAGTVDGKVRVTFPEGGHDIDGAKIELALDMKNVRRTELRDAFAAIGERTGQAVPAESSAEENSPAESALPTEEKEDNSRINATFAGALVAPDLDSLDAAGKFTMSEDGIFELQVFGGFSRLLSSVGIDLTSFNLDRGEGSYVVRGGKIYLPDLRIFSESGEVTVQADVAVPDLAIEGEAVFRNLRGTRIPILGMLFRWGSASTEILPVLITGTLDEIGWKIDPTPSRLWETPEARYGIAPPRERGSAADSENPPENAAENPSEISVPAEIPQTAGTPEE